MLSDEEKELILAEMVRHGHREAALVQTLKIIQKCRGWVSDEALSDLAALVEMTPEELDSIATFYSHIFRSPVGRHVIFLCDSVSCWIMGFENMQEFVSRHLGIEMGQTTPDGRFTLLPAACLGHCDHAPVMLIDDHLHGDLTGEKIKGILEQYE